MVALSFETLYTPVKFDVSPKKHFKSFSVSTPINDLLIARWVYKNFTITLSQKHSSTDPIQLQMIDFTIILGMGWLHCNYCYVYCRTRIISFQVLDEEILEWKDRILFFMGRLISYLKSKKLYLMVIFII